MPAWIVVLQGLLTPIIALIAVGVAFMQWRTAHQKVVLDLFDRRLNIYADLEEVALEFQVNRGTTAVIPKLTSAFLRSKFLFGPEAFAEINAFYNAVTSYEDIDAATTIYDQPQAEKIRAKNNSALDAVMRFRNDMPNIFEPYLRMSQKRVRTPKEWFHDANAKRLSYSDKN